MDAEIINYVDESGNRVRTKIKEKQKEKKDDRRNK